MKLLDNITPLEQDFARWYTDVVTQGDLIAYGPSKGSMVFKPNAYGLWEMIQSTLNPIFKSQKVKNVYLPLLIPLSYFNKEKEHIKGFAPELATITQVGDKKLDEPMVIRPTSEVLFCELFASETSSYNDLPIIYNQWANVVRWEKTTNPFLRNREFLWQEGHTVHNSEQEARDFSLKMINIYANYLKDYLAIPVLIGQKTEHEKFAGAEVTYTIEAMMKDGKALQSGTSHYLGQNFSKPYNIQFKNQENKFEYAYQTSWGLSTRLIGAIIMSHGDNRGIIIPPRVAPNQIDILEIFGHKNPNVREVSQKLYNLLSNNYRIRLDDSDKGAGFKAGQSEIEGTPLRIEIGPRDLENNEVTLVRRDTLEKILIKIEDVELKVKELLEDIHNNLYQCAKDRLEKNIVKTNSYDELKTMIEDKKFVLTYFDGSNEDEEAIKKECGATARCVPFDYQDQSTGVCFYTKRPTSRLVIFARAY